METAGRRGWAISGRHGVRVHRPAFRYQSVSQPPLRDIFERSRRATFGSGATASVIDFDRNDEWGPSLTSVLKDHLPSGFVAQIARYQPEFLEDALSIVFEIGNREPIIDATLEWLRSHTILGYHGTRLTDSEIRSVQETGLLPLEARARHTRISRALSHHPDWSNQHHRLDALIKAYGPDARVGKREGQAHLTLSRAGLVNSFNHYLAYGSEFDQRVAYDLLGPDGVELLANDGKPVLLTFGVPGPDALLAAHPFFDVTMMRERGEVPNIVREFLEVWSYALADPAYFARQRQLDCGLFFRDRVSPEWLLTTECLQDVPGG